MKRHWIEYEKNQVDAPMTFWVHREADGRHWADAEVFEPPRQGPVPGKGYPVLRVEHNGFTFGFASLEEMAVCIEILSRRLLPRSIDLSRERGPDVGPNSHWLSRLPGTVTPWAYRRNAVAHLRIALEEFRREIT